MKSFQFKDLMVNVGAAGQQALCFGLTGGCGFAYSCGYSYCGIQYTYCGYPSHCIFHTRICPAAYTWPEVAQPPLQQVALAPAGGAPQFAAGAGAGAIACALQTVQPCINFTCGVTNPCGFHTCHFGCSIWITEICRIGPTFIACQQVTCAPSFDPTPTIQVDPQGVASQLAAVKAQLQQELAAIEQHEKAAAEALRPQTAADIEELQGKLRNAIAELDQRKQELQGASEKPKRK